MWSNTFATALVLEPAPSRIQAAWLCGLHGLASLGLLAATGWIPGLAALVVLLVSLRWHLRRAGWLGGHMPVSRLRIEVNGDWRVMDTQGEWHPATVLPGSLCTSVLCVLQLRVGRRRHAMVFTGDSVTADTLRQLRVRLLGTQPDRPDEDRGIGRWLKRLVILRGEDTPKTIPMSTHQERLEALLSDDPDHVYSDEELDAIEAIDPEMALRIDRVQTLARRGEGQAVADGPIDEARVREAVEEARRILMQDGGDIEFLAIEDRTVRVRLKGACVGCPRSTLDLQNVVERLVRSREPGVERVVNIF